MAEILADSNFVYALLYPRDREHRVASAYFEALGEQVLLPTVTLSEIAFLASRVGGNDAVIEVMRAVQYEFSLVDLSSSDYTRALEILSKYHDTRIDFVDACVMALAERLRISRILTFDRRDFGLFRPAHVDHFELLP
jgi:predicted nucleic acid-binding protein